MPGKQAGVWSQSFSSPGLCLGEWEAGPGETSKIPGSEGPGCVIIDQVLCVLGGGHSGAGRGRWWVVAAMPAEALSLALKEAITQDGYHHHYAGDQEHSNSQLHRAYIGNGTFPAQTKHILLGDATTGLKTLLFFLKVVLVTITTAVGKAGAAFKGRAVIPAWDVLITVSCVW